MHPAPSLWSSMLRLVGSVADVVTVTRVRRKVSQGTLEPVEMVPHRGYGTAEWLRLQVRVLEHTGVTPGVITDPWWRNVMTATRRFVSTEIPGAVVRATIDGQTYEAVADVEGYVRFQVPNTRPEQTGWRSATLELVGPLGHGQDSSTATGEIFVPECDAQIGIISDVDDTIMHTGLTETAGMLRTTFMLNASTRVPYPGVAAFYRALRDGGDVARPIFFVSGSPWNLYDMIVRFIDVQRIPRGPLFLKDWGIDEHKFIKENTHAYKFDRITQLLDTYPDLDFVLIGDSGQEDPEIYTDVITRRHERIAAVYIRDVTTDPSRDEAVRALLRTLTEHSVPSAFGPSTLSAAADAASQGLIDRESLDEVRRACEADSVD